MQGITAVKVAGTNVTTGCVLESSRGHYAGMYLVRTALVLGWQDEQANDLCDHYEDAYYSPTFDHQVWSDIMDDALGWLNDNTDDGVWYWWDGDLRLDTLAEYETLPSGGE